jgi:hypothetical protein
MEDFELKIDFVRHTADPARVFRSMAGLIDATISYNVALASSLAIGADIELILEDVRTGSLRTILRNTLRMIDKEALREGDWNKVIGRFLDNGREYLLGCLDEQPIIDNPKQLEVMQSDLQKIAATTELIHLPAPRPIPVSNILTSIRSISRATSYLRNDDHAFYSAETHIIEITKKVQVSDVLEDAILTREKRTMTVDAILPVKKPDFIGQSKWEMYYSNHPIKAPIEDTDWLSSFQAAKQDLNPGDALKTQLEITTSYDHTGQIMGHSFRVLKVFGIIPGLSYEQTELPINEA